jgi:hypothetical protein
MTKKKSPSGVVKARGIANENVEIEDVTFDQSEKAREEEFRRAEVAGDRMASRRDAEKIGRPGRSKS